MLGDILDGVVGALAEIAGFVAIPQLDGFVLAGGCAGGNRRAAHAAVGEPNIGFNGGVAAGVENLAANDFGDFHGELSD